MKVSSEMDPVGTCYVAVQNFSAYAEYSPCRTSEYFTHTHTHTQWFSHVLWGHSIRRSVFFNILDTLYFLSPYPNPTPHTKLSAILDFQTSFCMIYELFSSLGPKECLNLLLLLL